MSKTIAEKLDIINQNQEAIYEAGREAGLQDFLQQYMVIYEQQLSAPDSYIRHKVKLNGFSAGVAGGLRDFIISQIYPEGISTFDHFIVDFDNISYYLAEKISNRPVLASGSIMEGTKLIWLPYEA